MSRAALTQEKASPAIKPVSLPVQNGVLQRKCACGGSPGVDGECAQCREKRLRLQRSATGFSGPSLAVPPIVHEALSSPGQTLDAGTRAFMEPRFGHDFSNVRVHTDSKAAESARAVNALAYTVGRDVVFGVGQYAPRTSEGRMLMAHELTHTIQQGQSRVANISMVSTAQVSEQGDACEQEANQVASTVLSDFSDTSSQISIINHPAKLVISRANSSESSSSDAVVFNGNQLIIYRAGKNATEEVMRVDAKSGQPGHKEYEENIGTIPDGTYTISPNINNGTVKTVQAGTCGAESISSGYQKLTSNERLSCDGPPFGHYCNIPCGPPGAPASQMCFTPVSCWGHHRIRIETGTVRVKKPGGGTVPRKGFYIHGGNPGDPATSGCIKVFNEAVFDELRKFKHPVPLVVNKSAALAPGATPITP